VANFTRPRRRQAPVTVVETSAPRASVLTVSEVTKKTSKKCGLKSVKTFATRSRGIRYIRTPRATRAEKFINDSISWMKCKRDQHRGQGKARLASVASVVAGVLMLSQGCQTLRDYAIDLLVIAAGLLAWPGR